MRLMKLTKSFVEIPKRVRSSSAPECCFASSAANPKIQSTFKWKSKSFQVNMATARTWLCIVIEQDGFGQQFLALQLPQNSPIDTFCNPSNFCSVWRSCKFFFKFYAVSKYLKKYLKCLFKKVFIWIFCIFNLIFAM